MKSYQCAWCGDILPIPPDFAQGIMEQRIHVLKCPQSPYMRLSNNNHKLIVELTTAQNALETEKNRVKYLETKLKDMELYNNMKKKGNRK